MHRKNARDRFRLPFYLICDFESFLSPVDEDDVDAAEATKLIDIHNVCGLPCYRTREISNRSRRASSPNVIDKFYEHVMNESLENSD